MELTNEIKDYLSRLDRINELETELKEAKKSVTQLDATLAERMRQENIDSLAVEGIKFQPTDDINFSLAASMEGLKWDNPIFFEWLRKEGLQDIIKIKQSVHPQTRNRVLKDMKEEGKVLPDFVKVGYYLHLKYNKSAVGRREK